MRNRYIDYLRGISILLVLALHFLIIPQSVPGIPQIAVIARNGYYGVSIFFVISGYLITSRMIARFGSLPVISSGEFYAMRIGRIIPCMFLTLAILIVLNSVGPKSFHDQHVWKMSWYVLTFRFNLYRLRFSTSVVAWDVLWSLSIEEFFYFAYPIVCRIFHNTKYIFAFLLIVATYGPFYRLYYQSANCLYTYLGCVDLIALGCITAILAASFPIRSDAGRYLFAMLGLVVISASLIWLPIYAYYAVGPTLIGLGAVFYLYAFHGCSRDAETRWTSIIGLRMLAACGRLSYEIYLFHGIFILLLLEFYRQTDYPVFTSFAYTALFCVLTVGSAHLISKFYSEPAGKILRQIFTRIVSKLQRENIG